MNKKIFGLDFKNILQISSGAFILAISQNLFIIPSGLLSGGLSGISLMINYTTGILPVGVLYFIFNLPMVFIALKKFNKNFTIISFYAVLIMNISQVLTFKISGKLGELDPIISAVFGGALSGIGAGLVYRNGASTMGTDIPTMLLKRKYNINIGTSGFTINIMVLVVAAFLFGAEIALYTIIALFVSSRVADHLMLGIGERKNVMIMTKKYDEISKAIIKDVVRGVTLLDGEGAYSKQETKVIFTVVTTRQIVAIKNIVAKYDPNAFITISESSEVRGRGFKNYDNE